MSISLRKNTSGVLTLPFKLLIVTIIIGVTVTVAWQGLAYYSQNQIELSVEREISRIKSMAVQLYSAGVGNVETLNIKFANTMFHTVDYIKIGANITTNRAHANIIRYKISGLAEKIDVVTNPSVLFMSSKGETLVLCSGEYRLSMVCDYIVLNGEDVKYIELSIITP